MTGGSLGLSFYESTVPPSTHGSQAKSARLPDNADEQLVKDTIYLHDPDLALPNRSLVRRRAFQHLQNRYYRQILYGCVNPHCETPTCLSRQKRVSKGPFRPFTVLSARTLATVLASEDYPEKGLCRHKPVNLDAAAMNGPGLIRKDNRAIQTIKGSSKSPLRSPASPSTDRTPYSGSVESPIINTNTRVPVRNGHVKSSSPDLGHTKSNNAVESKEEPKKGNQIRKDKDPKSFAQNLFDTAAMKLLQLANIPEGYLTWVPWTEREHQDNMFDGDRSQKEPRMATQSHQDAAKSAQIDDTNAQKPIDSIEESRHSLHGELRESVDRPDPVSLGPDSGDDTSSKPFSMDTDKKQKENHGSSDAAHNLNSHRSASEEAIRATKPRLQPSSSEDRNSSSAEGVVLETSSQYTGRTIMKTTPNAVVQLGAAPAQSLSHFTFANMQALLHTLEKNHADIFAEHCLLRSRGRTDSPSRLSSLLPDKAKAYRDFLAYSAQSTTYVLSNTEAIMQSFLHCDDSTSSSRVIQSYEFPLMVRCFHLLRKLDFHPSTIFPSLWISAGELYPISNVRKRNSTTNIGISSLGDPHRFRDGVEVFHIAKVTFAALVASIPNCSTKMWTHVTNLRAFGQIAPQMPNEGFRFPEENRWVRGVLSIAIAFENQMAHDLTTRLVRAIVARHIWLCLQESTSRARRAQEDGSDSSNVFAEVMRYIMNDKIKILVADNGARSNIKSGELNTTDGLEEGKDMQRPMLVILEWLRAVILKEWDGKPRVPTFSSVRGALELLSYIYACNSPRIESDVFETPFLAERLDVMEMPLDWAKSTSDTDSVHLLSYPFMFPPSSLISYFRAINHATMYKAFESAAMAEHLAHRMTFTRAETGPGVIRLKDRLRIAQSNYLVLEVRREEVLRDALDQLWRRQRRELMRPLKIRMGMQEGEEGVDHGGVQQEFFRVAVAEAMNPDYGAFTTDPQSQMSWFQPGSLEPLYKFELLGLLVSLAVYNGLTLPFTFPRAMYRKLLKLPIRGLGDIEDGWPELTRGLSVLRDWPEENVEEVFTRPYVFSVDVFGTTVDMDMEKAQRNTLRRNGKQERLRRDEEVKKETQKMPSQEPAITKKRRKEDSSSGFSISSSEDEDEPFHQLTFLPISPRKKVDSNPEPTMVTNENRQDYISDYIAHLTHFTIRNQFSAFATGFFTCLSPKSISLFTPSTLKALVEGLPHIEVKSLEGVTRYEGGYHHFHPTIVKFWTVVNSWPQEKVQQLLEFVTASDRLPVGGVERVTFVVQKNGLGDGRLPTSLTCFGRLLLPEYDSEEKLREGLEIAVANSKGFGQP